MFIISRIVKFFLYKKKFKLPNENSILVYDKVKIDNLNEIIENINYELLNVRNEINFLVLLKCIFHFKFTKIDYILHYIKVVNPKIILTLADNDILFYKIKKKYHKELIVISIQNGWRSISDDIFFQLKKYKSKINLSSDCILTFSNKIGVEYQKYIKTKIYPVGNIINNNYHIDSTSNKIKNSILLISQWIEGNTNENNKIMFSLFKYLNKYSKDNSKSLGILLRKDTDKERKFFDLKENKNFHFIEKNKSENSYYWIDKYEIVISIDSTLGYESLSRGNKTLFFSIRSNFRANQGFTFGWPNDYEECGVNWTNKNNFSYFEDILNALFLMTHQQWRNQIEKNNLNNIMLYDKGNLRLKNFFKKILMKYNIYV